MQDDTARPHEPGNRRRPRREGSYPGPSNLLGFFFGGPTICCPSKKENQDSELEMK